MIRYYRTIESNLEKLNTFEENCWINLIEPTNSEVNIISSLLDLDKECLEAALDDEERSRIESEDNYTLILIDIPIDESNNKSSYYSTVPLGVILMDKVIITVCNSQTKIINDFIVGHVKDFYTYKKTRFVLQILRTNASYYLNYLRNINRQTIEIEKEIYKSMKNKELIQLLELEKSLVYFSTSLKSNELILNKMLRFNFLKKYPEDDEILDDVIIENKQAVEMATIYGEILSRIMDAFSAIINNNQNNVMQFLTVITLIFSIPNIISGLFGMNVLGLPFSHNPFGFCIIISVSALVSLGVALFMFRKKLL